MRPSVKVSAAADLARLQVEVLRLRGLSATMAETAAAALVRAGRAEDLAAAAAARAAAAEDRLASALDELALVRTDLKSLRTHLASTHEELVWAFAEGRLPVAPVGSVPVVVDLRAGKSRTA